MGGRPPSGSVPAVRNTALRFAALLAVIFALAGASADAAGTAPTVKVFFAQGEQLVAVDRPGATVQDALTALVAGPTSAETAKSFRTYVPPGTRVRSVTMNGTVAVVDLGASFMQGDGHRHDAGAARPGREHGDLRARA